MEYWLVVNDVLAWIIVLQAIFFVGLTLPQFSEVCPRAWLHALALLVVVYIGTIYLLTALEVLPLVPRAFLLRPAFSFVIAVLTSYTLAERR